MLNENLALSTTVVGSFPLDFTNENMIRVFEDQINSGINFPCYPQLVDMIFQFLNPLSKKIEELDKENNNFILQDDFEIPEKPIAQNYGIFVKNYLKRNRNVLGRLTGIKACLTGPITLTTELILGGELSKGVKTRIFKEPRAIMKDWVVEKFANIMNKVGKNYRDLGFDIIAMDEPILSLLVGRRSLFHKEDFYLKIINKALEGIDGYTSIHVCGSLNPNLRDLLLKSNVRILDHEFQTNEQNFEVYKREHLEENNKMLAIGSVRTNVKSGSSKDPKDYVEEIKDIEKFIKKGIKQYGRSNLIIKPDCGFRALQGVFGSELAYQISVRKLKNMVKARNNIIEQ
jgi:5-methyltetrahydropteroyltriglutamate--homocysteine methyltransferase